MKLLILLITLLLITSESIKHHNLRMINNKMKQQIIILNTIIMTLSFSPHASFGDNSNTPPIDIDLNRVKLIRQTENFLTNPVLEAYRKMDQLEADETTGLSSQKALLLYPIIEISKEIENIKDKLQYIQTETNNDKIITTLTDIQSVLAPTKYNDKEFKKIFNRYSDNIFYTDSRRANVYLGGGAIPDSDQTNKYLYRNVALTSIQNLKQDIDTLITEKQWNDKQAIIDTIDDIREGLDAFKSYFSLVDPEDVKLALDIYQSNHK